MSLMKIPGSILFAITCHIMAFSAPNPPPEDMEVRVLAFMERAVAQTLGVVTLQVCACFPGPWCESELMRTQSYLAAIHVCTGIA